MRKIKGFSLLEVIIVLVIISIILISIFGVFKYVLNNKVAYYVYNFYNELQYINKAIEKNLRKDNEAYKDQLFTVILKEIDAKKYCSAIVDSVNTIDKVDCNNSSSNITLQDKLNKDVEYNCSRIWYIKIDEDGSVAGLTPDEQYPNCSDITSLADALTCNATPTSIISDSAINNTTYTYTYVCNKENNLEEDNTNPLTSFNVDTKPNVEGSIKTANNINLEFLSFDNSQTLNVNYNLNAELYQDHICPAFDAHDYNCSQMNNGVHSSVSSWFNSYLTPTLTKTNNQCKYNNIGAKYLVRLSYNGTNPWNESYTCSNTKLYPEDTVSCVNRINAAKIRKDTNQLQSDEFQSSCLTKEYKGSHLNLRGQFTLKSFHKIYYSYSEAVKQYYNKYYTKWNNFFTNYGAAKQEIKPINGGIYSEGSVQAEISGEVNTKHFIYAAIDKDFSKAEMNKDIFVFEQYGDKIIPVGYLANNNNSPLKFNVYTRDSQDHHVSKVAGNLTYCDAMSYVGGKVSEYCGCTDEKGAAVTKFEKNEEKCGTLGCDLRAARPNFNSIWLPSK